MTNGLEFTTSLWKRGQSSYATTIPKPILLARGIPVEEDIDVVWSINDRGNLVVEFEVNDEAEEAGGDGE